MSAHRTRQYYNIIYTRFNFSPISSANIGSSVSFRRQVVLSVRLAGHKTYLPPQTTMSTATQYVWYGSFGSNLCSERFRCYLQGGRVAGMSVSQPGCRDTTVPFRVPPTLDCPTTSMVVPHRLFFAQVSPWWDNGGVAFLDVSSVEDDESWFSHLRLWRTTLEQYNDIFAQENGLDPNDEDAFERFTAEDVHELASSRSGSHRIRDSWYGYCHGLGFARTGEPILTFTLPPAELRAIRTGAAVDVVNPPSQGYHDVICRGLVELGIDRAEADAYLKSRHVLCNR